MKKILITGGCGYLGARISEYLSIKGYHVTVFDRAIPNGNNTWVSLIDDFVIGDIRDETVISKLTQKSFDVVVHLISLDHRDSESNPNLVNSINVIPTWNLLENFSQLGLEKFIYFSTFQVYGRLRTGEITEDYIPSPLNKYGLTHMISENICNFYNRKTDINCIDVRLSNSYGSPVFASNNCWWLVINDLCRSAFYNKQIILLSDGSPMRDFIHSSDVCRAIEILVNTTKKEIQNNTYHVSSGKTHTILELAHFVKNIYKKRFHEDIEIVLPNKITSENADSYKNVKRYIVKNSKLKSLGFIPQTELESGFNEIFDYFDKQ